MVAGKVKKPGKRGRKPAKIDLKAKLERSRQSARECRARKKLRYQYLEELVSSKERAICALREELDMVNTRSIWSVADANLCLLSRADAVRVSAVQAVVSGHGPGEDPVRNQSPPDRRRAESAAELQQQDPQERQEQDVLDGSGASAFGCVNVNSVDSQCFICRFVVMGRLK